MSKKGAIQFSELVKSMRTAPKQYFATRDRECLDRSKELERQVDDVIARTERILADKEQGKKQ